MRRPSASSSAAALASKDVDAAVRKDQALAAEVKAAQDAVDEEEKQAKQRADALDEARADWDKELKALKALLPWTLHKRSERRNL